MKQDKWHKKLSDEQHRVLREGGTEPPFSGAWLYNDRSGSYLCVGCGQELFSSDTKFDSGSGWPSFYDVADPKAVALKEDRSQGMPRVEITCSQCQGHLGHVFHDAPDQPTGLRFCVNSTALDFQPHQNRDQ